jgi:hypothetical protein
MYTFNRRAIGRIVFCIGFNNIVLLKYIKTLRYCFVLTNYNSKQ